MSHPELVLLRYVTQKGNCHKPLAMTQTDADD
jgi:hypothetical protein